MSIIIKKMNLTEKDIACLQYLHAVKVATYEQIKRDIYPAYSLGGVCNRLLKLESNGLVSGLRNRMLAKGKRYFFLTKIGFENFVAKGHERRIELKSDAVNHDLGLVDIRFSMSKANRVIGMQTENEIQTWGDQAYDAFGRFLTLNSDAVLLLRFPKGELYVPMEYELNGKSTERYEPLIKRYYGRDDVTLVLYICESLEILKRISKLEMKLFPSDKPKFFYKLMDEVGKDEAFTFNNFHGWPIYLNQIKSDEQLMK